MSNKKQFEYIENRIKQAVENGQPAYDQSAWEKMEALLDKKEKKRRPFIWWFIFPLLLAGTWGIYKLSQSPVLPKTNAANIPGASAKVQQGIKADRSKIIQPGNKDFVPLAEEKTDAPGDGTAETAQRNTGANISPLSSKRNGSISNTNAVKKAKPGPYHDDAMAVAGKKIIESGDKDKITTSQTDQGDKEVAVSVKQNSQNDSSANTALLQTGKIKPDQKTDKAVSSKNKDKGTKGFYFLGAAGIDIASVDPFSYSNSAASAKYGIGLGYQLNNKWSVQTGFYVSNKKYVAGPDDYHPKGYYWNSPAIKIEAVDAKCLVYEIPVTVKYNFILKPSVLYYLSASASSYIMQEEDYNYHYDSSGVYHQKYSEYTGNKHLFSTLTFAGGIEKLSPAFSIWAEPSFSIPISGVGYGSVKLYSTALQVGIKYKPSKKH